MSLGNIARFSLASWGVVMGVGSGTLVTIVLMLVWADTSETPRLSSYVVFIAPLLASILSGIISLQFVPSQWKPSSATAWGVVPGTLSFLFAAGVCIIIAPPVGLITPPWLPQLFQAEANWDVLIGRVQAWDDYEAIAKIGFAIAQLLVFAMFLRLLIIKRFLPYRCDCCGNRCPVKRDISRTAITTTKQLRQYIEQRDWESIRQLGRPTNKQWLRFDVARCNRCHRGQALSVSRRTGWRTRQVIHNLAITPDDMGTIPSLSQPTSAPPLSATETIDTVLNNFSCEAEITHPNLALSSALAATLLPHTATENSPSDTTKVTF